LPRLDCGKAIDSDVFSNVVILLAINYRLTRLPVSRQFQGLFKGQ